MLTTSVKQIDKSTYLLDKKVLKEKVGLLYLQILIIWIYTEKIELLSNLLSKNTSV